MNKIQRRKMIVPIIITVIIILYLALYFGFLLEMTEGIWKYALGILSLFFIIVMIMVCVERIKEIKRGEDDDIGKY